MRQSGRFLVGVLLLGPLVGCGEGDEGQQARAHVSSEVARTFAKGKLTKEKVAKDGGAKANGSVARSGDLLGASGSVPTAVVSRDVGPPPTSRAPSPTPSANGEWLPPPSAAGLSVKRFVTARGVEGREPVGAGDVFGVKDGPVYAFLEMANASGAEGEITVHWERADGSDKRGEVTLSVGDSPRWRTWALTRTLRDGDWFAVVTGDDGSELGRVALRVE